MVIGGFGVGITILRGGRVGNGKNGFIILQTVKWTLYADLFYILKIIAPANNDTVIPNISKGKIGKCILCLQACIGKK